MGAHSGRPRGMHSGAPLGRELLGSRSRLGGVGSPFDLVSGALATFGLLTLRSHCMFVVYVCSERPYAVWLS